jgi:hypothetical protein
MVTATQQRAAKRRVVHIDPLSAARVAFALSLTVFAILLVGLVALYLLALASGALNSVEGFISGFGLTDSPTYHISLAGVLPGFMLVSIVCCAVFSAVATVFAILYNTLADLVGGVVVVTRER